MTTNQGSFRPDELAGSDADIPDAERAEAYAAARELEQALSTAGVHTPTGFTDRVMSAVALEPVPRPTGFLAPLRARHSLAGVFASVRVAWSVAAGSGRPAAARGLAMAYVLAIVVIGASLTGAAAVGAAGAIGILTPDHSPRPSVVLQEPTSSPEPSSESSEPAESSEPPGTIEPSGRRHHVGARSCLGRRRRRLIAVECHPGQRLGGGAVVDHDLVAGLGKMTGHRCAHDTQAEKRNLRHGRRVWHAPTPTLGKSSGGSGSVAGVVRDTRRRGDGRGLDMVCVDVERARLREARRRRDRRRDPVRITRHRRAPGDPPGPGRSARSCVDDALLVGAEAFAVHQGDGVALRGHGDHDTPPSRRGRALGDLHRTADTELETPDRTVGTDRPTRPQHGDDLQPPPVAARRRGVTPIRGRTGERDRRRDR